VSHLDEIRLLNVKVQSLETKYQALRTSNDLSSSAKMDLKKMYVDQKVYDKTGLGYINSLPSSISKVTGSPKEKIEQSKKLENKSDNMKNTKDNRGKQHHAYQYKYSNRRKKNNNYH
jgi:hypothetical protein